MTKAGACMAASICAIALTGAIIGYRPMMLLGGYVPMGFVSILFLSILSWGAISNHRLTWLGLVGIILFALAAMYARGTGNILYHVPDGSGGFWKPSSSTALFCYILLALAVLYRSRPYRVGALWAAFTLGAISVAGYALPGSDHMRLGFVAMALPSALAIVSLSGGMLLDLMEARPHGITAG